MCAGPFSIRRVGVVASASSMASDRAASSSSSHACWRLRLLSAPLLLLSPLLPLFLLPPFDLLRRRRLRRGLGTVGCTGSCTFALSMSSSSPISLSLRASKKFALRSGCCCCCCGGGCCDDCGGFGCCGCCGRFGCSGSGFSCCFGCCCWCCRCLSGSDVGVFAGSTWTGVVVGTLDGCWGRFELIFDIDARILVDATFSFPRSRCSCGIDLVGCLNLVAAMSVGVLPVCARTCTSWSAM